jgi:hypothetical protein
VHNCTHYGDLTENEYGGKISSESRIISFGGCPDSILLNDKYVARLRQLVKVAGQKHCLYRHGSLILKCEK